MGALPKDCSARARRRATRLARLLISTSGTAPTRRRLAVRDRFGLGRRLSILVGARQQRNWRRKDTHSPNRCSPARAVPGWLSGWRPDNSIEPTPLRGSAQFRRWAALMIGDVLGEVLGGLLRLVGSFLLDIVLEVLVKGPGYLLARSFKPRVNPDGALSMCVGLIFWVAVGGAGYWLYRHLTASAA